MQSSELHDRWQKPTFTTPTTYFWNEKQARQKAYDKILYDKEGAFNTQAKALTLMYQYIHAW